MDLCKLKCFLMLIFLGLYNFTNTAFGFNPIEDGVYSNYTNANSVHKEALTRYKSSIYHGNKQNKNTYIANNEEAIDFKVLYNNAVENVKKSNLISIEKTQSKNNDTYTLEKLIERQTKIPTTEKNRENYFQAYNQQHKNKKGVQFSEIVSEINNSDEEFNSTSTSFKTYSKNNDSTNKVSFENVLRRVNNQGITNTKMLDKIDGIYFAPNISKAYENKLENSAKSNMVNEKIFDQNLEKVQVYGSM